MYLTDLTDAQKEYIKGTILNENWRSKYDFFLMLDAIIYIDVSGCQWRLLPAEYPKWQTVYYYFRRWGAMDAFSEIEDSLVEQVRVRRGEFPQPTIGAIDSESSRAALPRSQKGIDGNKKVKGMKRNISICLRDGALTDTSLKSDGEVIAELFNSSSQRSQIASNTGLFAFAVSVPLVKRRAFLSQ